MADTGIAVPPWALWLLRPFEQAQRQETDMKVSASVKIRCAKCRVIRRHGKVMVICDNLRHKQRQG